MKSWLAILTLALANSAMAQLPTAALQQAKDALLDGEYALGVERYQVLLAQADQGQHAEALEYLGVAYEKLGQTDKAQSSYQAYLQRFSDGPGAPRVQQRLDVLNAQDTDFSSAIPRQQVPGPWSVYGGISQDFWLDSFETDGAGEADSRTNLITFVNLGADYRGERVDLGSRLDAGYQNVLSDTDSSRTDSGNDLLISNAYLSVTDQKLGLGGTVGRQTLYSDGVLGRFDGVRATYAWRDNIRFNTTLGLAVDSPRFQGDTRRSFYGVSAHIDDVLDQFDVQLFAIMRTNEGVSDREAIGTQVSWRRERWQVVGNLDMDLSYQTLNSAFVYANFAYSDRLSLYARGNLFAQPFLTTTNSLIGQPYSSVDALAEQQNFSDAQLRTLARNRTAEAWTATGGFTFNLSQRWYANGNVTYSSNDGSISSGDVAAAPKFQQFFSAIDLIGASIFRNGDTTVLGYRLQSTSAADTNTVRFEVRLPFGSKLRIGPMLNASYRDAVSGDQQIILEPGLRASYRWGGRYRLELEGRGRFSNRQLPDALQDTGLYPFEDERSATYFLQLGWRADL
ncbi:MAG: tol-pal system YbgF family protein [Pseudomonadales bacterium]